MHIEQCDPSHLVDVMTHPKQRHYQPLLESSPFPSVNWSMFSGDELICVGGLVGLYDAVGAWLLFTDRITPGRFVAVYREMKRRLAELLEGGDPVLVHIDPDYPEALRMANMLGFRKDGEDHIDGRTMIRMVADV